MNGRLYTALVLAGLVWLLALPAQAAITVTEQLSEAQTVDNDASWTSVGTFDIASGATGVCFVFTSDAAGGLTQPTLTGGSVTTWTASESVTFNLIAVPTLRVTVFWGLGSGAAAAAVTADFAADSQTSVAWQCEELAGAHTTTPFLQDKSGASDLTTAHTVTLDSARGSNSALLFALMVDGDSTDTEEMGYTPFTQRDNTGPGTASHVMYVIGGTDTTPTWTTNANEISGFVAIEIAEAAAASTLRTQLLLGVGP